MEDIPLTHIAIMRKDWGLTQKIQSGEKTIETRWYKNRTKPWNKIKPQDTIYFKDSGKPVALKAKVEKILQFEDLTPAGVMDILDQYGKQIGIQEKEKNSFYSIIKEKRYCILIFLTNVEKVPLFQINKKGFGALSAWITVSDINKIKV